MNLVELRRDYHRLLCGRVIGTKWSTTYSRKCPSFADVGNRSSIDLSWGIVNRLGHDLTSKTIGGQTLGGVFEELTTAFLEKAFGLLHHLRPGEWEYSTNQPISGFDQYEHLAALEKLIEMDRQLAAAMGTDYIIRPDIVVLAALLRIKRSTGRDWWWARRTR